LNSVVIGDPRNKCLTLTVLVIKNCGPMIPKILQKITDFKRAS
jgi:hypothetical protein